jgi:hypothetical protein
MDAGIELKGNIEPFKRKPFREIAKVLKVNPEDPECLTEYCMYQIDYGKDIAHYLSILVRQVSDYQQNKYPDSNFLRLKKVISQAFKNREAVPVLLKDILHDNLPNENFASLLSYIAFMIRDHGAMRSCSMILEKCHSLQKENTFYLLMLVNSLQVLFEYNKALDFIAAFFKIHLKEFLFDTATGKFIYPDYLKIKQLTDKKEDLYILCLTFYSIQILFLQGKLKYLNSWLSRIDYFINNSPKLRVDLTDTEIKTEYYYYMYTVELIKYYTEKSEVIDNIEENLKKYKPLYVIGDPHVLSISFQLVKYHDEVRVTLPLLATGLQINHLRDECDFFPAVNFENAVSRLSTVKSLDVIIMSAGEIDIREDYFEYVDNPQEFVDERVKILMKKVKEMQKNLKCKILITPIFPSLERFRDIDLLYNKALEKAIKKAQNKNIILITNRYSEILNNNKELNEEFKLNYVYITPKWLKFVEYFEYIPQELN